MRIDLNILLSSITLVMLTFIIILIIIKRRLKSLPQYEPYLPYDDGTPRKYYITGDKHRNFKDVERFCKQLNTRKKDVLIILGDAGLNYYGDERDEELKKSVSALNITLFCIHGNKENRPSNVGTYGMRNFCGGKVYYEPRFPNLLFAIDGEVYTFQKRKYIVIGGAESIDKTLCIANNKPYWDDEVPSAETKALVEDKLNFLGNTVYGVLTHTCPHRYVPTEMFLSARKNIPGAKKNHNKKLQLYTPYIERTTEKWLDIIYETTDSKVWFCGHYHVDKEIEDITMLHNEIRPLYMEKTE